jgi:ribosomal protein S21
MTIRIVVREAESISQALRRLRKEMQHSGMAWEIRRRCYPADMTNQRRAKRFQKRFKAREATLLEQLAGLQPVASLKEAKAQFWRRTGKP